MSKLAWDQVGERYYETGVDHGVLFPYKTVEGTSGYQKGVAWNGLTAVNENPSGAEATPLWADNIKYLNLMSNEEFGATIEAYTYPNEFAECDGSAALDCGVVLHQQKRSSFGFSYRTKVGNDVEGSDLAYKIHLVYGALASPSSKSYNTVNDSPEAITFSWEVSTTPVNVSGYKPVAHLEVDSRNTDPEKLQALEDILYGTENTDSRLPLPDEVIDICTNGGSVSGSVTINRHSTTVVAGSTVSLAAETVPAGETVTWTSANENVATVSNGVVTGVAAGNTIITASITVDGVTYTDTCTVVVTAEAEG